MPKDSALLMRSLDTWLKRISFCESLNAKRRLIIQLVRRNDSCRIGYLRGCSILGYLYHEETSVWSTRISREVLQMIFGRGECDSFVRSVRLGSHEGFSLGGVKVVEDIYNKVPRTVPLNSMCTSLRDIDAPRYPEAVRKSLLSFLPAVPACREFDDPKDRLSFIAFPTVR